MPLAAYSNCINGRKAHFLNMSLRRSLIEWFADRWLNILDVRFIATRFAAIDTPQPGQGMR